MAFQVGPFQTNYQQVVDEELLGTGFGGSLYYRGVTVRIFGKPYRIVRRDQLQAIIEKEFAKEVKQAKQEKRTKQAKPETKPVLTLSTELLEEISQKNIQTLAEANSLLLVIDELLIMEEMVMLLMMEAI